MVGRGAYGSSAAPPRQSPFASGVQESANQCVARTG